MLTYFTTSDYFGKWLGHPDMTLEVHQNAEDLLQRVNLVCEICDLEGGIEFLLNPKTNSYVSGAQYGGFRPQDTSIGAPSSSHKQGKAVDIYDPKGEIADWCLKHLAVLTEHGLYMEHPSKTVGWAHLTTRAPRSGKRVFYP
jgi:hypothetical protein